MYNLFLDDVRMPYDVGNYMLPVELGAMYRKEEWIIVRNFNDFKKALDEKGIPNKVSFDHDLGEDVAVELREWGMSKRQARKYKKQSKSGYDCAKDLINCCHAKKIPLPEYYCHSMNPIGKENILVLLNNFKKFQNGEETENQAKT